MTDRSGAKALDAAIKPEEHKKDFLKCKIEALKEVPSKFSLMD